MPSSEATPHVSNLGAYLGKCSFWVPWLTLDSAWIEHAPFAFWLTSVLKPRRFVELGTHRGFSYFVVCQAISELKLDCECIAVDHWLGDEHAGFYGDEIYESVRKIASERFGGIAKLVRASFSEAAAKHEDASVDLLHIDGRHFYDDVREDFESWRQKLTDRSVVLIHDTQVFDRGFGVHKFWAELASQFPAFEFEHGHGLGVLGYGSRQSPEMVRFFAATSDMDGATEARSVYERLGLALRAGVYRDTLGRSESRVSALEAEVAAMRGTLSWRITAPLRAAGRIRTERLADARKCVRALGRRHDDL